jgi:ribosomal protein S18 acetylase RimI-like enzyme
MKIRLFNLDDLTELIAFSKRAYGYEQEQQHLDDLRELLECCARMIQEHPEGMFVAEVDGKVVGTAFAIASEPPGKGSVHWMGVDPAQQGKGIGKKLLSRAEAYLRSRGARHVDLGTDRPNAVPFYISQGYGIFNSLMRKPLIQGRRTKVQRVIEIVEAYAACRFTHHNVDQLTRQLEELLKRRPKIDDILKIADEYVMYPVTSKRTRAARNGLRSLLKAR